MNVRVGLVGLGIISEVHLTVLAELPTALSFTVDPRPDLPPRFRDVTPPRYDDLSAALAAHDVDLVVIAAPTTTHSALVTEALTRSSARVLVEKPLVHDLAALSQLRSLEGIVDLQARVFVAHHFAFSPEVVWCAAQIAGHPEWGPVTGITSAFYDPYTLRGEQAFASYVSSWLDSGINQLSMLARFVELDSLTSAEETDGGASAWCTVDYRSADTAGTARLRTSWLTGSSSKRTTLSLGQSDVEVWIDHTAMTAFAAQGDRMLAAYGNDGRTPRKIAHYQPLYESLLSDDPDPVMQFDTAATVTELLHTTPQAQPSGR